MTWLLNVGIVLAIAAFILTIAAAAGIGRVPLWIAVLLLSLLAILKAWPAGWTPK